MRIWGEDMGCQILIAYFAFCLPAEGLISVENSRCPLPGFSFMICEHLPAGPPTKGELVSAVLT